MQDGLQSELKDRTAELREEVCYPSAHNEVILSGLSAAVIDHSSGNKVRALLSLLNSRMSVHGFQGAVMLQRGHQTLPKSHH